MWSSVLIVLTFANLFSFSFFGWDYFFKSDHWVNLLFYLQSIIINLSLYSGHRKNQKKGGSWWKNFSAIVLSLSLSISHTRTETDAHGTVITLMIYLSDYCRYHFLCTISSEDFNLECLTHISLIPRYIIVDIFHACVVFFSFPILVPFWWEMASSGICCHRKLDMNGDFTFTLSAICESFFPRPSCF